MRGSFLPAALVAFIATTGAATAQDAVDLKGSWVGRTEAVAIGTPVHSDTPHPDPRQPGLSERNVTLTITGQDGRRFWGTFGSSGGSEPIIGVFSTPDSFMFVDREGYTNGTVRGDTIEWMYGRSGDTMVAARVVLTRQ